MTLTTVDGKTGVRRVMTAAEEVAFLAEQDSRFPVLSRAQLMIGLELSTALGGLGKTEAEVLTAISKMPEPNQTVARNKFLNGIEFHRNGPFIADLALAMSLSDADIDAAWKAAATI